MSIISDGDKEIITEGNTEVILAIVGVGVALAGLIVTTWGRLSARLTAVEKETARMAGLLEGLGLTGRVRSESWNDLEPAE